MEQNFVWFILSIAPVLPNIWWWKRDKNVLIIDLAMALMMFFVLTLSQSYLAAIMMLCFTAIVHFIYWMRRKR
jgi:hypothetical protein